MENESLSATRTVDRPAGAVFAVLIDPSHHAAIDGTGWVTEAVDASPLNEVGQLFQMAMYHPDHPDGSYETVNRVTVLERDRAIAWETGYVDDGGELVFDGWWWQYDLLPLGEQETEVVLTYDWSDVGPGPREELDFPPFGVDHLSRSLGHLAELAR